MLISVIVPCYNEEAVLEQTHQRLVGVLERLDGLKFELIYVDDGSTDQTPNVLQRLLRSDRDVRVLRLSRNFGHQIALTAGLEHAAGDGVVIIDADLQDPPEVILEMVDCWRNGYHMAYGVRTDRVGETRFKLWTAKLFYRLIARLTNAGIPNEAGDFRLMDRKVVDALLQMPERDRFMRGMASWVGFRQIQVPYSRVPRAAGASKYSVLNMVRFAIDGVTSFSLAPLRLAIWTGVLVLGLAMAGAVTSLWLWLFTGAAISGRVLLLTAVFFLGAVQLICLGIIGEYVGRIYGEAKRRPLYFVQERLGFEKKDQEARADRHSSGAAG